MSADILIITGHPNRESLSSHIADVYKTTATSMGAKVKTIHLSELDFDPVLHKGYNEIQPLEPDLLRVQKEIEEARHVVWVYPMWWVGAPAVLKGFIERVFLPGWAFKYDENAAIPRKLLKGRSSRIIMTMDSPNWWYALAYRRAATHSFKYGILKFSGFNPVKTTTLYGIKEMNSAQLGKALEKVKKAATYDMKMVPARSASPRELTATL